LKNIFPFHTSPWTLLVLCLMVVSASGYGDSIAAPKTVEVLLVDSVGNSGSHPSSDILAVSLVQTNDGQPALRVSFLSLAKELPGFLGNDDLSSKSLNGLSLNIKASLGDHAEVTVADFAYGSLAGKSTRSHSRLDSDPDALYIPLDPSSLQRATQEKPLHLTITATAQLASGERSVESVQASYPPSRDYQAHCAFVLHGNQGLGYSDVFHGRSDDLEGSGFDEAMQVHQGRNIPGNFHLSGTLQSSAEWSARNGDPVDFNAWLATGVTEGWAGMVTSAYAQHIMPFVNNDMNDWAVHTETEMIDTRYGYYPTVGWVPERVWLNTSGYPSSGVSDWIGDNWQNHGVNGVILDDDVHLAGHDNHQIHTLTGNGLRLIPRDRDFTGHIIGGNGQAALNILTALAGGGQGQYRIAVFAEDWEAASEMGGWASIVPNATETYDWIINKCADESAWLHAWKLSDAMANADFSGDTMSITPGTYWEIGGTDGYGGGDNGWYNHWAGWIPAANGGDGNGSCSGGGNCKDYGTLWNDAYNALVAAPDNNISQAGWYVMMTNLYETGWHDGIVGPISGWEHNYSAHIKNTMVYAEAAHWANGEYATPVNAYFIDIDNDGYDECVIHNDAVFGVFEGVGGRLTHLFSSENGGHCIIGVDNAYWSGTSGDYNDANHVGALSEVSPNYQHNQYDINILSSGPDRAVVRLSHGEVSKDVALSTSDAFLDVVYRVGPSAHWWQAGFSPSLVDLIWNAQMDRVWDPASGSIGWRNTNTGMSGGWLLGSGGAGHQRDFSGTLMKGDELTGSGVMQMRIFAGYDPDGSRMADLSSAVSDTIGPLPVSGTAMSGSQQVRVVFDQLTVSGSLTAGQVFIGSVDLSGATTSATEAAYTVNYDVDAATMAAILALTPEARLLTMTAGVVADEYGNNTTGVTASDNIIVGLITAALSIDGNIDATEWAEALVLDDAADSAWSADNEIDRLLVQWDADFLYLAIDGQVASNSWLLYLDVDPGQSTGALDLTAIDSWERGASFSIPGAGIDFQYGCYQHQSAWDGDGFWKILSETTTQDISGEIESAFDSAHLNGTASGSELAIPWSVIYGLGEGEVPVGAEIAIVASVCWDPDPDGEVGGDSAPSNIAAALPVIDNMWTVTIDANQDGLPDGTETSPVPEAFDSGVRLLGNVPNPFNPSTEIRFEIPGNGPAEVEMALYDIRGHKIMELVRGELEPGLHSVRWSGQTAQGLPAAAGTYFVQLKSRGQVETRPISLVK
jgi:hypothetical protein